MEFHTWSTQHGALLMLQVAPSGRATAPSPGRQHFAAAAAAESSPPQKRQRPGSGGAAGAKVEEGDALPPIFHEAASSIGADIQICTFAYLRQHEDASFATFQQLCISSTSIIHSNA